MDMDIDLGTFGLIETISQEVNFSNTDSVLNSSHITRGIYYPRSMTIIAAVAAILFMIVGCFGNLVTIIALWRSQKLRVHATTWFILSLCVSDLLFCSINLPLTAARYIHEKWILGEALCRLFPFFFYGNVATSLLSMVAITVNRYILIGHYALYDRIYRRNNIIAMIAFVWIFSFSMLIPPFFEVYGCMGLDPHTFSCTILKKDGKSPKKLLFVFGILIPCIVIIFCYSCIFFKVRQSRRNLQTHRNELNGTDKDKRKSAQKKDDLRLTKMMLLIFCCFLLSFLPLMIFNVVDDEVKLPELHVLASILAWQSAVINPGIYALTNRQYRQAYFDLFTCGKSMPVLGTQPTSRSSGKTMCTEMVPVPAANADSTNNGKSNGDTVVITNASIAASTNGHDKKDSNA